MQIDGEQIVIPISRETTSRIKKCETVKKKLFTIHKIIVIFQALSLLGVLAWGNAAIYATMALIISSIVIISIIGIYNRMERKLFDEEIIKSEDYKETGMKRAIILPEIDNRKD